MKVVFIDKKTMRYKMVPYVDRIQRQPYKTEYEWVTVNTDGHYEYFKCSRFDIDKVERDMWDVRDDQISAKTSYKI